MPAGEQTLHVFAKKKHSKGGCQALGIFNLIVKPQPFAKVDSIPAQCINNSALDLLPYAIDKGGFFTLPAVPEAIQNDVLLPSLLRPGVYEIFYNLEGDNGCTARIAQDVVIDTVPSVFAGNDIYTCKTSPAIKLRGMPVSGTWNGVGILYSGGQPFFLPSVAGAGKHTPIFRFRDKLSGICDNADSLNIFVFDPDDVSGGADTTLCTATERYELQPYPKGGVWLPVVAPPQAYSSSKGEFYPQTAGRGTYKLAYLYNHKGLCTELDTLTIKVEQTPTLTLSLEGGTTSFCSSDSNGYRLDGGRSEGLHNYSGTGIVGNSFYPQLAGRGQHVLRISYQADAEGCLAIDSVLITIYEPNKAEVKLATNCISTQPYRLELRLSAPAHAELISTGGGDLTRLNSTLFSYRPTASELYKLSFQLVLRVDEQEGSPCPSSDDTLEFLLLDTPQSQAKVVAIPACGGQPLVARSTLAEDELLVWVLDDQLLNNTAHLLYYDKEFAPGPHKLEALFTTAQGCSKLRLITQFSIEAAPHSGVSLRDTVQYVDQAKFQLTASNPQLPDDAGYLWYLFNSTGAAVDTLAGRQPIFIPTDTGYYSIMHVRLNRSGCSDTVYLSHALLAAPRAIYFIPNAFSPNSDNEGGVRLNESFAPILHEVRWSRIRIYNRWGQQLFLSSAATPAWDGTFHGQPAPAGTYFYQLEFMTLDGQRSETRGSVELLR